MTRRNHQWYVDEKNAVEHTKNTYTEGDKEHKTH